MNNDIGTDEPENVRDWRIDLFPMGWVVVLRDTFRDSDGELYDWGWASTQRLFGYSSESDTHWGWLYPFLRCSGEKEDWSEVDIEELG